ncbi:hypothetical protein [Paenibacillus donghaensis]|uniref:Uncharacterized protein n=1 Tax=Paenibacillus donghaensis TaxID=414771 RepID=A0A2Z2KP61_9BACL|nr:hypothetical protein [Paenibacillus donghaensis]ASA21981.1 hypothetical protein B9T62_15060 [Paenibacillus donghaensis]
MGQDAERIEMHLNAGRITKHQANILNAYFQTGNLQQTVKVVGSSYNSIASTLTNLKLAGILEKASRRSPYKIRDGSAQAAVMEKMAINKLSLQGDIQISDFEREWMLKNYRRSYQGKRGAAAAALGCDRWRVCQLAIALKLDQKNA